MSKLFTALALAGSIVGTPAFAQSPEASEFRVKVPDGDVLQLRTAASDHANAAAVLLDGLIVRNIGCKQVDGQHWCLVRYERTDEYGWAAAAALVKEPPFQIPNASGTPVAEEKMPEICRAQASESFGVDLLEVEMLSVKLESGGFVIDGTADHSLQMRTESGKDAPSLVPFKCLFDKEGRFVDTMPMLSDGE